MLNLEKLYQKSKIFHRLAGLTPIKFQELLEKLEPLYKEAEFKRKNYPNRERKIGGGRKQTLSLDQALFLLLLYYRTYTNHIFIGMIGGIDDSNVGRYFKRIEPLLAKIFKIPERKIDLNQEEILEIIIDATEQETERRKGSGYSGKKKRNTVKTQVIISPKGIIKAISKPVKGSIHDKNLYERTKVITGKKVKRKGDLGYIGTDCQTPVKKPKGKPLTTKQKEFNRKFNQDRIIIEHSISHLKQFRILSHRFRNKISSYYLIFKNIAGLRNYAVETG